MNEVVLDASVVLKWLRAGEPGTAQALELRDAYEAGRLSVAVPSLLFLEIMNAAGRSWRLPEEELLELASACRELEFDVLEPDILAVADWVSSGLTAYDAAYVALAETLGRRVVTADEQILRTATELAVSPSTFSA